ncbi:hypothetical protein QBC43DRAFT_125813 [Cladorrhinum sp. PSN259]|nr:hypothetical protein QBC43DRAFT_125813 [Cladorrhinum sp. PSN259]
MATILLPKSAISDPKSEAQDNGRATLVVLWILLVVSGIFLGLRVYAKVWRGRYLWYDDHVLMASWALMLGNVCVVTKMVSIGYGKHIMFVDPTHIPDMVLLGQISLTFTVTALSWSKTSFAITLLRVTQLWTKKVVWGIIISMNLLFFWTALVHWIYCSPLAAAWNPSIKGKCWSYALVVNFDILANAYSAAMDFALSLLAWYAIKDLVMKTREKAAVIVSMSLGIFAGGVAIVKCTYLPTMLDMDVTYTGSFLAIWGEAELAATVIASSVPVLRALVAEKLSTDRSQTAGMSKNHRTSTHPTLHHEDLGASDVALQHMKPSGRSTPETLS